MENLGTLGHVTVKYIRNSWSDMIGIDTDGTYKKTNPKSDGGDLQQFHVPTQSAHKTISEIDCCFGTQLF